MKTAEIVDNTATLVAACAFFSGAWQVLAEGQTRQFADSEAPLIRYLAQHFHLSEENAAAFLDAVLRLARRYCYIEDACRLGMHSAREWQSKQAQEGSRLAPYLRRHAHITMAELGFAGVKEIAGEAAGAAAVGRGDTAAGLGARHRRRLAWVMAMLLLLTALAWRYWPFGAVEMPW